MVHGGDGRDSVSSCFPQEFANLEIGPALSLSASLIACYTLRASHTRRHGRRAKDSEIHAPNMSLGM